MAQIVFCFILKKFNRPIRVFYTSLCKSCLGMDDFVSHSILYVFLYCFICHVRIPFCKVYYSLDFVVSNIFVDYIELSPHTFSFYHSSRQKVVSIYSRLSLSQTRLSRITAYLEVKIWSLPKHENLTTRKNIVEKRRNCS